MMTLVTGAELFTGNTALVTAAVLEKKASLKQLVKSWTVSYSGNLAGSILLAAMVATGGTPGPTHPNPDPPPHPSPSTLGPTNPNPEPPPPPSPGTLGPLGGASVGT